MKPRFAYPVAFVSGGLLTLAFPEPGVWPLAWIAFAPTLYLTTGVGPRRGALTWAFFGAGFFGAVLFWISVVGFLPWGLLLVLQTLFVIAFGATWGWLSGRTNILGRIALAGGAWAFFEYLRSIVPLRGFTFGQLAQSQHDMSWLLKWSSVAGGISLALVIVATNAAFVEVAVALRGRRFRDIAVPAVVIALAVAGPAGIWPPQTDGPVITAAVVQGNVDPLVPQDFAKDLRILNRHVELTEQIEEEVDLVVWPESAAAIDPDNHPVVPPLLERAARAVRAPMIIGGSEDVGDGTDHYQVMAFHLAPTGEIVDRYQKTHLVPFGEYVPWREYLDWIPALDQVPRDALPGDDPKLFRVRDVPIATVLSFEGDFGSLVRSRVAAGGRLVIVATNTSTWLNTWASAQHVAFSQVRAVENNVPVVHAALSGISAVISPEGAVIDSVPLFTEGTMVVTMGVGAAGTPYARFGDPLLFVAIALCLALWEVGRRVRSRVPSPDG